VSLPSEPLFAGDVPVPVTGVKTNGFIPLIGRNFTTDVTWDYPGSPSLTYLVMYSTGDPTNTSTVCFPPFSFCNLLTL
jgi:hypothetical protein